MYLIYNSSGQMVGPGHTDSHHSYAVACEHSYRKRDEIYTIFIIEPGFKPIFDRQYKAGHKYMKVMGVAA